MVFTYSKTVNQYYNERTDENEEETMDFDYEVSNVEVKEALVDILTNLYANGVHSSESARKSFDRFVDDFDLETLKECYVDELKEYFREEALESVE